MIGFIVNALNIVQAILCGVCAYGAWRTCKDYARDFGTFEKYAAFGVGAMGVLAIVNCFI